MTRTITINGVEMAWRDDEHGSLMGVYAPQFYYASIVNNGKDFYYSEEVPWTSCTNFIETTPFPPDLVDADIEAKRRYVEVVFRMNTKSV